MYIHEKDSKMFLLNLKTKQEIDKLLYTHEPEYSIIWVSNGCWVKSLSYQKYKLHGLRSLIFSTSFTPTIYIYGEKTRANYLAAKSIKNCAKNYLKELGEDKEEILVKKCLSKHFKWLFL